MVSFSIAFLKAKEQQKMLYPLNFRPDAGKQINEF